MEKTSIKSPTEQRQGLEVSDRISSLPDAIICHILSFVDIKLAVQTTILSKKWLHLWKYIPALNINGENFHIAYQFVRRHETPTVHTLTIHRLPQNFYYHYYDEDGYDYDESMYTVNRVIHHVVSRQVRHVEFRLNHNRFDPTDSPYDSLFASKSLTTLKLRHIFLFTVPTFNLPSLKTLSLHDVIFDSPGGDYLLTNIFLGCENLEHLEISICVLENQPIPTCDFQNNLTSSSLKTLRLYKVDIRVDEKDEILVSDMFSGFVSLENLEITTCYIFNVDIFIISCPQLVNLKISNVTFFDVEKTKMVVSAPKLTFFKIEMDRFFGCVELVQLRKKLTSPVELVLDNITSLQILDFHMTNNLCPEIPSTEWLENNFPPIVNLFKSLSSVKSLYLTLDAVELLALFTGMLAHQICPLENLETMKVRRRGSNKDANFQIPCEVIRYLCSGSPKLNEMDVLLE